MNVTDPIRTHARERPDAIAAVRQRGRAVSYAELDAAIDAVARRMLGLGIVPGNLATVSIAVPYRELVTMLALARIGAAAAPGSLPAGRAAIGFVDRTDDVRGGMRTIVVDRGWFDGPSTADAPVPSHQDGAAAAAVFASTSADGETRFLAVPHATMAARVAFVGRALPLPRSVRQASVPAAHCAHGFLSALRLLWAGGTHVYLPNERGELVRALRDQSVDRLVTIPGALPALIAELPPEARPLPALREIELSGDALPEPLYALARERLCDTIHTVYRTSEGGCIAAAAVVTLDRAAGEVGVVMPGVEIVAVDPDGRPMPLGSEGMLCMHGASFVDGYLDDAAGTARAFRGGAFVSGDLGSVSRDGMIRLGRRTGDLIHAGGMRMHPRTVERTLATLDWVAEVAAFGFVDEHGITRVAAAFVPKGKVEPGDVARLRGRTAAVPSVLMQVPTIPRDERGAVRRDALVALAAAGRGSAVRA